MIDKAMYNLRKYLSTSEDLYARQQERAYQLRGFEQASLKAKIRDTGRPYYYIRMKGANKYSYLGGENHPDVCKIKEAHFLQESMRTIENNNRLVRDLLKGYQSIGTKAVNSRLPKSYRIAGGADLASNADDRARKWKEQAEAYKATFKPYYPENLTVRTNDGSYVRSKSETLIYNILLSLGITFVYELPLKTRTRLFRPDFTILSEIDYETTIIIEHLGMMGKEFYRDKNFEKIMDYMNEGYVQGLNIFYSYEPLDGKVDMSPIFDIIDMKIRPKQ